MYAIFMKSEKQQFNYITENNTTLADIVLSLQIYNLLIANKLFFLKYDTLFFMSIR